MSEIIENMEENERIVPGMLGALLFSLIGGVLWVMLFWADMFPGICGTACVVGAVIGYRIFSKKGSLKGVLLSVAVSVITMLIAMYFCLAIDVYRVFNEWYANGEYDHAVSFISSIAYAHQFFASPEVLTLMLKEFGWGLLFCVLGAFTFIVDGIKQYRMQRE